MIICQSLAEARAVPGVIAIVSGADFRAYVQGDVLPPEAVIDATLLANNLARDASIDGDLAGASIGATQPATLAQLKAMTLAQYSSWFDANFTTTATAVALLKRLTLIVIRRLL